MYGLVIGIVRHMGMWYLMNLNNGNFIHVDGEDLKFSSHSDAVQYLEDNA